MFFILLVLIAIVAVIGLVSVVGAGFAAIGALVLLPILVFKVLFLFMIFGFLGRGFRYRGWDLPGRRRPRPGRTEQSAAAEDRFEAWHRMAHAREEVDSWVEDLPTEAE